MLKSYRTSSHETKILQIQTPGTSVKDSNLTHI